LDHRVSLDHVSHLTCMVCGREYPAGDIYVCTEHGNEGILDVRYHHDQIALTRESLAADGDPTMWRYRAVMPVASDVTFSPPTVGGTPTYEAPRLAEQVGVGRLWVKDECRQPTASLKDRASAMAVVKAQEFDAAVITTASTGNAAAALSGLCAGVGQPNVIFVPESAPEAKVAQLLAYGSTVVLVRGNYSDAFDLCMAAAESHGWYNRNTGFNPYMTEGKKTAMFELLEQLAWDVPDAVFVSVGDGSIIGGLHKGAEDALALGLIDSIPRLYGIQAAGSDFMVQAFEVGEDVLTKAPIAADTIADSISADLPRDRIKAMAAVIETGGSYLRVSDGAILEAIPALARGSGVFAEPAGAAAYAGVLEAVDRGLVGPSDRIAVVSTGSGLKDVAAAMLAASAVGTEPLHVAPDLAALDAALEGKGIR